MNRPWMPLYIADYRADTAHLSASQHGAYLLLIMHYWQTGGLPTDDAPLARIACLTPTEWRKTRAVIASFFTTDWRHKRIDTELAKAADISSKRRASAEQRHSNRNANAQQLDTHARATSQPQLQSQERKQDAAIAAPEFEGLENKPGKKENGAHGGDLAGDEKSQFYARARKIFGANSGGFAKKLLDAKEGNVALARAALETASTKGDRAREYIGRIIHGAAAPIEQQVDPHF